MREDAESGQHYGKDTAAARTVSNRDRTVVEPDNF